MKDDEKQKELDAVESELAKAKKRRRSSIKKRRKTVTPPKLPPDRMKANKTKQKITKRTTRKMRKR